MIQAETDAKGLREFASLGAIGGILAFLVHTALAGRPFLPEYLPPSYPNAVPAAPSLHAGDGAGKTLYEKTCAACHQANGQGLTAAFPPLAGSSWVRRDRETPIRIALLGVGGPIEVEGKTFESSMPALGLDDTQIALILSYVRGAWGNAAPPISQDDVAKVRASLLGRTQAWDAQTLSALRQKE